MVVNRDRLINSFIKMANISSPSLKEREFADYLIKKLRSLGMEISEDGAGEVIGGDCGNITAVLKGDKSKESIMFSAHMDTVGPCENVLAVMVGSRIESKGDTVLGGDDKIGVAGIVEMLECIVEGKLAHPDIIVIFSVAEEIRLLGAKEYNFDDISVKRGIILDSSGKPGTLVNQAPFHDEITFIFRGKSAHAGIEPEKGLNALFVASEAISQMTIGRIDGETTFNLGKIEGGLATNIVMEEVRIIGEIRSFSEEKLKKEREKILKICKDTSNLYEKAEFNYTVVREYDGYYISEESEFFQLVKRSILNGGFEFEAHSLGGGSDANVYNQKSVETINLGIGMSNIHSCEEYVEIEDLISVSEILLSILKEIE